MTSKRVNAGALLDLERFADQAEELIDLCERLQKENDALRARCMRLESERATLVGRHDVSRRRIEAMISRLKILENEL